MPNQKRYENSNKKIRLQPSVCSFWGQLFWVEKIRKRSRNKSRKIIASKRLKNLSTKLSGLLSRISTPFESRPKIILIKPERRLVRVRVKISQAVRGVLGQCQIPSFADSRIILSRYFAIIIFC